MDQAKFSAAAGATKQRVNEGVSLAKTAAQKFVSKQVNQLFVEVL